MRIRCGASSVFLARCGVVAGADGIFMEIHENPEQALSDGPNALPINKLKALLENLVELKKVYRSQDAVVA